MRSIAVRSLIALLTLAPMPVLGQEPRFHLPDGTIDYRLPKRVFGRGCGGPASLPEGNAPQPPDPSGNERATLGRVLFHDPLLSKNRTTSCATCHRQSLAFADDRARSRGFDGRSTARNSMAIVDLAEHDGPFFWDGRSPSLEAMVLRPIQDPIEMGLDLDTMLARLRSEPGYAELFRRAFGDPTIDTPRVAAALALFVRAIASVDSRYDRGLAVTGDVRAAFPDFSDAENRGKRLFFGQSDEQASCASCHVRRMRTCTNAGPLRPDAFGSDECTNNGLDDGRRPLDLGQGAVTKRSADAGKFRAPSLRNIALTAPYMHDGRFATLDEVLRFYSHGVKEHPRLDVRLGGTSADGSGWAGRRPDDGPTATTASMTTSTIGFPLTSRDRADLIAFLETLTDHELVHDPRFADPFR